MAYPFCQNNVNDIYYFQTLCQIRMSAFKFVFISVACMLFFHYEEAKDVSKCYSCSDKCKDPMEIETCRTDGHYSCMSAKRGPPNKTIKACISDYDLPSIKACEFLDNKPNQYCFICESDLCNSSKIWSLSGILLLGLIVVCKIL